MGQDLLETYDSYIIFSQKGEMFLGLEDVDDRPQSGV